MDLNRRDFLKASTAVAAAFGIKTSGILSPEDAAALEADQGGLPVVWLQAQACTGCSVSLLNSVYYTTINDLLLNTLDLQYHPNLMAAAGASAQAAAQAAYDKGGFILVVEGAVPRGAS